MGLYDALPDNEDEIEDENNKIPYDSISSREPISDPRGRNPMSEQMAEQGISPLDALSGQMAGLSSHYGLAQLPPGIPKAGWEKMLPVRQAVMKKILQKKTPAQMPGSVSRTSPPVQAQDEPISRSPQSVVDDSMPDLPTPDYSAIVGGNQFGNLALAGSQLAQGAGKPQNQNAVGNALNSQNQQIARLMAHDNDNKSRVMAAIQARKAAQEFRAGQNDLNRQNKLAAKQIPSGNPNAQDNFERSLALRKEALDSRNEQQANNQFKNETSQYITALDSSNRLLHVLDAVDSGALTSSANVAASMANDISQLLSNSKNTAVSDRQHAEINSLEGTWNKIKSYAQNKPLDTIPKEYLDQYRQELGILKNSILQAYKNKTNELKSGTTNKNKQNVFQKRYESQAGAHAPISPTPADPMQTGTVMIKNPDTGKIYAVPADQAEAAKAAGGIPQ